MDANLSAADAAFPASDSKLAHVWRQAKFKFVQLKLPFSMSKWATATSDDSVQQSQTVLFVCWTGRCTPGDVHVKISRSE